MKLRDKFYLSSLNLLFKMYDTKRAEKFSPKKLEELQKRRLSRLLRYVVTHSEFYREFYKSHGIDIENIEQVDLKDLPLIDKDTVMNNFDKLVCDKSLRKTEIEDFLNKDSTVGKRYKDIYEVVHTSGSSGNTGIFVYGPNEWATIKAVVVLRVSKPKIKLIKKGKLAFLGAIDGHFAGVSLNRDAPRLFFNFLSLDINNSLEDNLEKLNDFMPDNLSGYSSGIYLLALEQLKGNLDISPKRIVCSADPLTREMSREIFNAFNVEPINFYAATESIGMASECDSRDKAIHLFNDIHIFETVDRDGESVEKDTPGNLVLTSLYNYTQPLIRYKMDDEAVIDGTHSCSWPFPVLSALCGREEEVLWFSDSSDREVFIHPLVFIELKIDGLVKLQVVEVSKNNLVFNVAIDDKESRVIETLREEIDKILELKKLKNTVEYKIVSVSDIPNDPKTGKFRGVIVSKNNDSIKE